MLTRMTLLLMLFMGFSFLAAQTPDGFTKVKAQDGIEEYRMDSNNLSILLMEDHSAPVVTFMVTFRVGSRNEVTGTTGATHILEHLMFKGTEKYNKANGGHIDNQLGNIGAMLNATTWTDRTNYYESIPSNYLELAIDIESDRMRNLLLREEDRDAEMTVVRNEFERGENSPVSALEKEIWATAFQAHPYHHSTIGWRSDIENVPIEKLREFYNTFYWPNNATVTVIGDFEKNNTLQLLKKYYGAIPASPHKIPELYTTEPEQEGPRRVILKRPGQLGVVGIGWKIPEALNKDTYTLSVLSNVLENGKTSRLYKALVDQNKAVNAFTDHSIFKDPSLFLTYAYLAPGVTHEEVEKILLDEIEKIKTEGVTDAEVNRAINQITASTAFGRDGSFSIASQLNEAIAHGDWTFYTTYLDNIKKVTAAEVQDAAKKYFVEEKSTTGYYIPIVPGGGEEKPAPSSWQAGQDALYYRTPGIDYIAEPAVTPAAPEQESSIMDITKRQKINGIDVITAKTGVKDVVTFTGSLTAGDILSDGDNKMVADLTGRMLDKGTTKNDKFALAEKLENMGASINFSVGKFNLGFSGRCLKQDLPAVIDLLAEQLRMPAFSEEELEKLKKQTEGNLKRQMDNTGARADEALNRLIFSKDHPNYEEEISKLLEDVKTVTIDDIKKFHSKYYGPKSMIFVAAGDVDNGAISKAFEKAFSGWTGGVEPQGYKRQVPQTKSGMHVVTMEGKTSTDVLIGQATGLKRADDDYLPFYIANTVLGSGFAGRLMSIIRDDEGLTYGIYSTHNEDEYCDGRWYIGATFAPDLLDKGLSSTMREFKRWVNDGVTEQEFKDAVTRRVGQYKVRLATSRGMASTILDFIQNGFDISYLDQYPKDLNKLTHSQVNNIIKKYIDPDAVVTVVAGSVDENGKPLSSKDN
ncbi:MAG: insulinase family protein [Calditrichae bacterium]|nr:insulinase family protein [Calditrichota bacterium]MCB9058764.1 insulinase family protein [Calditrichia bacterium]